MKASAVNYIPTKTEYIFLFLYISVTVKVPDLMCPKIPDLSGSKSAKMALALGYILRHQPTPQLDIKEIATYPDRAGICLCKSPCEPKGLGLGAVVL